MDEIDTLKAELEHYRRQKEQIRDVVGQIGGRSHPARYTAVNVGFLVLVLGAFAFEALRVGFHWDVPIIPQALILELAVLLVSLKIIWMIHTQSKVDHFQFWVLNSIEFQISIISRRVNELSEKVNASDTSSDARS
jgi:hypothetical protein